LAGIYISWPFCAQKCTFCNFASGVQPKELEVRYGEALRAEFRRHEWKWVPETLYIGGGTPSSVDGDQLRELLADLPGRPWREATIETAPGSVTPEKIVAWLAAGINRVSLGVQSFIKHELARTGRKHDAAVVEQEIALLRKMGIPNINVDLIAGLPGQTEASWRDSLDAVRRLDPPHVSVYMLEVDEDSRLGSEIILGGKRYGASDTPSDDAMATFYEQAAEALADVGIARYEISNFAKPGYESLHNLKYWQQEAYVGFGADAHSFDGGERWQNVESAKDYVGAWERGDSPAIERMTPNADEEKFFVGLRLSCGVQVSEADEVRYGRTFERFIELGMMERSADRVRLTDRGIMVSNEVFQEFLSA
jgi:oxygen-independent coproporphyrinogen-3 oxidase